MRAAMDTNEFERLLDELRRIGSDHSTCEVKKAQGGMPGTAWETVSAFANAQGGMLILGIDEKHDFALVGIHDPGAMESQLGSVCSDMEPAVRADIQTLVVDGKAVVIAQIPPTPREQRPCYKRSLGPYAGSKLRVADGDRRLSDYEVSVLLANRSEQRHDLRAVDGATLADLSVRALDGFLDRIRETKGRIFASLSTEETLVMLNVVVKRGDELTPTLAGLLAFGVYPQRFEPQLDITVVAYPTTEAGGVGGLGERFSENRSVDGSIPLMVGECILVLKRNMRRRSIISGLFRQDEWEYPEEVLREVLVNALVHRDYSEFAKGTQVQVELYPDRLVVRNPGGLYGPVELTALGDTSISSSRNRALLKILEDTPLGDGHMVCENRGTGITRMRRVMVEAGMEQPHFTDAIATFQAEFPNHTILDQETIDSARIDHRRRPDENPDDRTGHDAQRSDHDEQRIPCRNRSPGQPDRAAGAEGTRRQGSDRPGRGTRWRGLPPPAGSRCRARRDRALRRRVAQVIGIRRTDRVAAPGLRSARRRGTDELGHRHSDGSGTTAGLGRIDGAPTERHGGDGRQASLEERDLASELSPHGHHESGELSPAGSRRLGGRG